jgi:hypothetical protein
VTGASARGKRHGAESEAPGRLLPYFAARRTSVGAMQDGAWRNARVAATFLTRSRSGHLRVGRWYLDAVLSRRGDNTLRICLFLEYGRLRVITLRHLT